MITRAEAIILFNTYNNNFSRRVDAQLRAAASAGLTSAVIGYEFVTNAVAAAVAAELIAGGWTVVNDSVGRTVTVS